MPMYRKKPVTIEAQQFMPDAPGPVAEWCGGNLSDRCLEIATLEGVMRADYGDWIIKGVKGEFYPCKPDIFAATYERV